MTFYCQHGKEMSFVSSNDSFNSLFPPINGHRQLWCSSHREDMPLVRGLVRVIKWKLAFVSREGHVSLPDIRSLWRMFS